MKKNLIMLALLWAYFPLLAQKESAPGYIVKSSGDTLRGYLRQELRNQPILSVSFRSASGSTANYSTADISSYGYENGNVYRAITYLNTMGDTSFSETVFAKILLHGGYSLYDYRQQDRLFFIVLENAASYFIYDAVISQTGIESEEGNFYAEVTQLASACKDKDLRPNSVNYNEHSMTDFVADLNTCVKPGQSVVKYSGRNNEKLNLVVYFGGMSSGNKSILTGELMLRFNYPSISRNLYFVTGVSFAKVTQQITPTLYNISFTYQGSDTYAALPVFLQYKLISGRIEPYIFGGVGGFYDDNVSQSFYIHGDIHQRSIQIKPFGGAGLEGFILKNLAIRASWWLGLYDQLPTVGLSYRF